MRTFLDCTDHLSDRELYAELWRNVLRVPEAVFAAGSTWNLNIDCSDGLRDSEQGMLTYLTYYAEEDDRQMWLEDFPDATLPERRELPYDRDRLLPCPPGMVRV